MRETGILFSAEMVRANLAGTKTQTRRVVKPQPNGGPNAEMVDLGAGFGLSDGCLSGEWRCPYGVPGDRLWVRETWSVLRAEPCEPHERDYQSLLNPVVVYAADGETRCFRGDRATGAGIYHGVVETRRPSIFMPRWASRLTLEVTGVRVERLQDISDDDVRAEGVQENGWTITPGDGFQYRAIEAYRTLWDSINEKRGYSWASNPWVWVLDYTKDTTTLTP